MNYGSSIENDFQSRYLETSRRSYGFTEKKSDHPDIIFNDNPVTKTSYQKHFGIPLDSKLEEYLMKLVNLLVLLARSELF